MKFQIPLAIAFISGIMMIISIFIPHHPFDQLTDIFTDWYMIIGTFAIILGVLSLLKVSLERISSKAPNWFYNIFTILGFLFMAGFGVFGGIEEGTVFYYGFEYLFTPMAATMFSMLAFFVASAAFRAFRARTLEATILLLAAFIVMLGRVPLGSFLWRDIPELTNWIMDVPNTAGQRAIMIGIALGIVSTSLRIILGIEKSYMGGE